MGKQLWKAGNMLYPLPAVMVSTGDAEGKYNIMTVAWTGTICSDPPMLYISVYAAPSIAGQFFVNLTTAATAFVTDYCGVKSGRDINKFEEMGLTPEKGLLKYAPMIAECPICIACRVVRVEELGSHDMFIANVEGVYADEQYMDENGRFDLMKAKPIVYSHGQYYGLGEHIGRFGFSVQKKKKKKKTGA